MAGGTRAGVTSVANTDWNGTGTADASQIDRLACRHLDAYAGVALSTARESVPLSDG